MSPYSIPTLVGAMAALFIGFFVLLKNIRSKTNISFALFCLSIFAWLFSFTISYSNKDPLVALLWAKAGCIAVDFTGPLFYHFVVTFLGLRKELKWIYIVYFLVSVVFLLSVGTEYIYLKEPMYHSWGYYPVAGSLHPLTILLHCTVVFRALFLLYSALEKLRVTFPSNKYNQVKYIYYGLWVMVFPALTDYLPKYRVEIYPFGWVFLLIFVAIVAFAILKHNLMDIAIVVRKGLIYSILAASVTAVFFTILLVTEKFFQGLVGYQSLIVTAIVGFIITLGFNPLKNWLQRFIDRRFFKGTVEEMAYQNERLMQQIQQADKLKAVATLAAGMAHEIKNPLTAVKTFSQYLPQKYADSDFINRYGQIVPQEIERINKIVADVLLFSKPKEPNFKEVNINNLLSDTLDFLSNDFLNKNIKVVKEFSLNHSVILADPDQMKQVFLNLFLNALDAMSFDGSLTVSSISDGQYLEIRIQDTGCGISEENLKHVFEPFHTTKSNGTGLGLAVVRNIINHHKAEIKVESEVGKGTRFILRFKAVKEK